MEIYVLLMQYLCFTDAIYEEICAKARRKERGWNRLVSECYKKITKIHRQICQMLAITKELKIEGYEVQEL